MSDPLRIPLTPGVADQVLSIVLDGNPYKVRVIWNEREGYFALSLLQADDTPILTNVKMVKNYPLIRRFANPFAPPGEFYFVQDSGSTPRPLFSELGTNYKLYYKSVDV